MGTGRVVGEPGEPVDLSGPVAVAGCRQSRRQAPFPSPRPTLCPRVAVTHTVKVTQAIWSDVRVHRSPWPHLGLARPWAPLPSPLQMHPGQVSTVNAKWKARGTRRVSLAGQGESQEGQSRGSFLRFPWDYERNPQSPRRSFQNTGGSLVASGPAQEQGRYWKRGWW